MALSIKIKIILVTLFLVSVSSLTIGFSLEEKISNDTLSLIIGVIFFSTVFSIIAAHKLIKPFDELMIGTQVVASGRLDYKIKKRSNDEIGRLVDSFNNMIIKLKKSYEKSSKYSNIATVEKQKAELIIDSMADGVIVTNSVHNIIMFNPAAEKLFQDDRNKVINKHIVNFFKKYKVEYLFKDFPELKDSILPVRKVKVKVKEFELKRPSKKIIKATIAPLKNESNVITGTVIVFEDITKEKEIDMMKTEFVSTVSHELRTPLTSIKGYAALLMDERLGQLNNKQQNSIKIINKESDRLTELINDILDLSKLESGKAKTNFKLLDIEECFKECQLLNLAKIKKIKLVKLFPNNLPKIYLDKPKIVQIFNNLISNAIKFTKEGGKITIKATNKKNHIIIDITDTGIGIARNEIPNLFNKFYQVENHLTRNQGGTGLGLPIVKEIIGLHHGLLSIKSNIGKGTTVSLALPKGTLKDSNNLKCWEENNCKKIKCPVFESNDKRCWLYFGTHCKKESNEPCIDKINTCAYCNVYKEGIEDKTPEENME